MFRDIYVCVYIYIYTHDMYTCEQDGKYIATKLDWLSDADVASLRGLPMHEEHD